MVIQAQRQRLHHENEGNNIQSAFAKKISIDPKTWVKLGHFHLLLEEYRKGTLIDSLKIYVIAFNCSIIRISNVL